MKPTHITLLGDGGWGTALCCVLARNGCAPMLWGAFPEIVEETRRLRESRRFLPGVRLPENIELTADLGEAIARADMLVFSTPVVYLRSVAERAAPHLKGRPVPVMTVAKGIERDTLLFASGILRDTLGVEDVGMLFGPSHADEVARRLPASVVAAARDAAFARRIQSAFMNDRFRVYTSDDPVGVETAAAVKNVIAIAAGICDGLGLGDNAKSALLTRGLAEIARLGEALGGKRETFAGLSGIGDLITTCYHPSGRNLRIGRAIGAGHTLEAALRELAPMVPEGVWTTQAVCALAQRHSVEMPISAAVRDVLFDGKPPRQAAEELMTREARSEMR